MDRLIISTMNASDLLKIFELDKQGIDHFMKTKSMLLYKELKKGLGKYAAQSYDYHTSNASYKCVICVQRSLGDSRANIYIFVPENNEYVCLNDRATESEAALYAYTPHYLFRYAERYLHKSNLNVNQAFAAMLKNFGIGFKIFQNKNQEVMAMPEGLALSKIDNKRDIVVHKTFVSTDMLKTSQIDAYEKVASLIDLYAPRFKSLGHYGPEFRHLIIELSNKIDELDISLADTQKIYGSFFEDEN